MRKGPGTEGCVCSHPAPAWLAGMASSGCVPDWVPLWPGAASGVSPVKKLCFTGLTVLDAGCEIGCIALGRMLGMACVRVSLHTWSPLLSCCAGEALAFITCTGLLSGESCGAWSMSFSSVGAAAELGLDTEAWQALALAAAALARPWWRVLLVNSWLVVTTAFFWAFRGFLL